MWLLEGNFMLNRREIKAEAKGIMRTARVSPYLVTLLVLAIGYVLEKVEMLAQFGSPFFTTTYAMTFYRAVLSGDTAALEEMAASLPAQTGGGFFFFSILISLFTLILNGGYYIYCMGIRRGAEMPYATLADGLGVAGKLIWCSIQISVKIFLWSLLLWIPGIVAAYRYRFAYYNILTDGSITAGDAIRLSCRQTSGMKWQLFVLDLSFLGWGLLSALTMGLLNVWLRPYMTLCDLACFEEGQRRVGRGTFNGGQRPPEAGDPWGQV